MEAANIALSTQAPARSARASTLRYQLAAAVVLLLVVAVYMIGYPLVIVLGITGTAAMLTVLVVLTAMDLVRDIRARK
ncbi:MAG: hypothetical protein KGM42_07115 [Hyphomicrobiales bacterium]|nr:hypothetical protein [Hyphomicrobiales bacterium]